MSDMIEDGCVIGAGCLAIFYILLVMALIIAVIFLIIQIASGNVF
jgi:hypothetical protein